MQGRGHFEQIFEFRDLEEFHLPHVDSGHVREHAYVSAGTSRSRAKGRERARAFPSVRVPFALYIYIRIYIDI